MNFEFTQEQNLVHNSVADYFRETYPFSAHLARLRVAADVDQARWNEMAALGWMGIGVQESHGGSGAGAEEFFGLMHACGASLNIEPLLSTATVAAPLLSRCITAHPRNAGFEDVVHEIVAGRRRITLAWAERGHGFDPLCIGSVVRREAGGANVVEARKLVVLDGASADYLIVSAMRLDEGAHQPVPALVMLGPETAGAARRRAHLVDGSAVGELDITGVQVDDSAILCEGESAQSLLLAAIATGIAGACAEALGAMERAIEITSAYLGERKQFGRPLAEFQALQHKFADMEIAAQRARSMSILAAIQSNAIAEGCRDPSVMRDLSLAKVVVGHAARMVGEATIQSHGGMGMAFEYPIGHYYRKLLAFDAHFGSQFAHLSALASGEGAWMR